MDHPRRVRDQDPVVVDGLVVRYPGMIRPAVDEATWSAAAGEVTVLLGPNGAGKTTTVECCVGLRHHQGGTVRILGRTGAELGTARHRCQVSVMLQDGGLATGVRPLALLTHLSRLYPHPADVTALAERLDIVSFARTSVRRLSGGQRQRLALAAALVAAPRVVFLDEPTAGLDTHARIVVREVLAEQCAAGVAVVMTTHDLDEAARTAHRAVVIADGRVVADDSPQTLTAGLPRTLSVRLPPGSDIAGLAAATGLTLLPAGGGRYQVSGAGMGPGQVAAVGAWCDRHGLTDVDLELRNPSLEDVVLTLTGRADGRQG